MIPGWSVGELVSTVHQRGPGTPGKAHFVRFSFPELLLARLRAPPSLDVLPVAGQLDAEDGLDAAERAVAGELVALGVHRLLRLGHEIATLSGQDHLGAVLLELSLAAAPEVLYRAELGAVGHAEHEFHSHRRRPLAHSDGLVDGAVVDVYCVPATSHAGVKLLHVVEELLAVEAPLAEDHQFLAAVADRAAAGDALVLVLAGALVELEVLAAMRPFLPLVTPPSEAALVQH